MKPLPPIEPCAECGRQMIVHKLPSGTFRILCPDVEGSMCLCWVGPVRRTKLGAVEASNRVMLAAKGGIDLTKLKPRKARVHIEPKKARAE